MKASLVDRVGESRNYLSSPLLYQRQRKENLKTAPSAVFKLIDK
jgi:hypothetical protein